MLDRVVRCKRIAITKHDEVRAVLLSAEEYEALLAHQRDPLSVLEHEFDDLVERMQVQKARKAGKALFEATPARLGRAALAGHKRR